MFFPTLPHFHLKKKKIPDIMSSVNTSACSSKRKRLFSKTWLPHHHHTKNKMDCNFLSSSNILSGFKVLWLAHDFFFFQIGFFEPASKRVYPLFTGLLSFIIRFQFRHCSLLAASLTPNAGACVPCLFCHSSWARHSITFTTGLHPEIDCELQEGKKGHWVMSLWCHCA